MEQNRIQEAIKQMTDPAKYPLRGKADGLRQGHLVVLQRKMAVLAQNNGVNFMVIDHAERVTADGLATDGILTALQHTAEYLRVVVIAIVDKG